MPQQLELFHVGTAKLAPLSFFPEGEPPTPSPKSPRRLSWAQLLARVFAIDITVCPRRPPDHATL